MVRHLDVLRQVAKECKRWRSRGDLGNVFDLDMLALDGGGRVMSNLRKKGIVKLGGRHFFDFVVIRPPQPFQSPEKSAFW